MNQSPFRPAPLVLAAALATVIFAVDLNVELGVATAVAYTAAVVLAANASGAALATWAAAAICSTLTLVGLLFSPPGSEFWKVAANRGVALIAIWAVAALSVRLHQLMRKSARQADAAVQAAEELKERHDDDVRRRRAMASIMEDLRIERRRLTESEQRLRLTVDSALDAVVTIDQQGDVVDWNPQAERIFGWPRSEAIGQSLAELIVPPQHREAHNRGLERFLATGEGAVINQRLELTARRRDNEEFPIELSVSPLKLEGAYQFSAFVRDITNQKRLEEKFRATVESAPTAMVMADQQGRIVLVNQETEKLFGYARSEMLGSPVELLVPQRYRDDHPGHRTAFFRAPESRRMGEGRELFGLRADGSEFPVEIGLNPIVMDDGLFVLSAILDITDRKKAEAEIRRFAMELERSNQELDEFAYSASHDLKAPLRAIDSLAKWIAKDAGHLLPAESREDLETMQQRIARLEQLLNDLLQYSRVGRTAHDVEEIDVADMVRDVVQLLAPPESFRVDIGALPVLTTHRTPLEQVFRNLIGNAIKHHHREHGRVEVAAEVDGPFVQFTVRDDGPGIAKEFLHQAFQMFKTLKPRDEVEGSGMGLAMVKKIVENHGGTIALESQPGEGSTFRFSWPKVVASAKPHQNEPAGRNALTSNAN